MADRCEYVEKLNKSLERVIVEKDGTIEGLTREIDDLNAIIRERNADVNDKMDIIHVLTDENSELKKELAKSKLNNTFGTMMDEATGVVTSYKDWLLNRDIKLDAASISDIKEKLNEINNSEILEKLKVAKEIVDIPDHNVWAIITIDNGNIWTKRFDKERTAKHVFSVFEYGKTWMFVDDLGNKIGVDFAKNVSDIYARVKIDKEVKSDDNGDK